MTISRTQNPYEVLDDALVDSITSGNRGKITGNQIGLSERLRQYAYFRQENAVEAGDAMLVNDLLDAVRRLERPRAVKMCPHGSVACTSPDRCKKSDQCLGGDYDAIARGDWQERACDGDFEEHIRQLHGSELDAFLRSEGFDPDDLLEQFNRVFR